MGRGHFRERIRQAERDLENSIGALLPESHHRLRTGLGEGRKASCATSYPVSAGSTFDGSLRNISKDVLPATPLRQSGNPSAGSVSCRHRGDGGGTGFDAGFFAPCDTAEPTEEREGIRRTINRTGAANRFEHRV